NDANVTFEGTLTAVNAALNGLRFTPAPDFNGASYLVIATNDLGNSGEGGPKVDADYVLLDVREVNDAPVRSAGTVADLTVNEDSGLTSLGLGGVTYSPRGGTYEAGQTLTIRVTQVPPAALGTLYLADGTTAVAANDVLTLAQLQGLKFRPAPDVF